MTTDEMSALIEGGSTVAGAVNAAYALGIQRARKVKPLECNQDDDDGECFSAYVGRRRYSHYLVVAGQWDLVIDGVPLGSFKTAGEAKAAREAHHAEFVLSQLEDAQ